MEWAPVTDNLTRTANWAHEEAVRVSHSGLPANATPQELRAAIPELERYAQAAEAYVRDGWTEEAGKKNVVHFRHPGVTDPHLRLFLDFALLPVRESEQEAKEVLTVIIGVIRGYIGGLCTCLCHNPRVLPNPKLDATVDGSKCPKCGCIHPSGRPL